MPADIPDFQRHQLSFTRHIRDPQRQPLPDGIDRRRMQVYNDLLFNNVFGLVSACFPVARTILAEGKWTALVKNFFARHRCHTPYFRQIPEEFLQFMQVREPLDDEPDFLIHLLHYEWVELALDVSDKNLDMRTVDAEADLGSGLPVLTPIHMLLNYPYAVHRIGEQYQPTPDQQEDTNLLVFRDTKDHVRFIVLNPVSARLVYLISLGNISGSNAVAQVVTELNHPDPELATKGGFAILEQLKRDGAIVGVSYLS